MLELLSPDKIKKSLYRRRLDEAGIKGGWNYALDHAWLFEKIDAYAKTHPQEMLIILDVGCGNSMLHTFLEEELRLGIIGIDRILGKCSFYDRDRRMDLCIDFTESNVFFQNSVDIVYWCSSIEHNSIEKQKVCVRRSLEALKSGGVFLATFGYSKITHYFEPSEQTNVDYNDARDVFGVDWVGTTDFDAVVAEYRENIFELDEKHYKRYGTREYDFIVGAAEIIKQ
jgi:hypothetical protein